MKTIIVLGIVILIAVYAFRGLYKSFIKKEGSCNCSGCGFSDKCNINSKK